MAKYRQVKASTLRKKHLPYCEHCLNYKKERMTDTHFSYSIKCLLNSNGELSQFHNHLGAGCPQFKEIPNL